MNKIIIDVSKCTGCGQCVLTCSFKQAGAFDLRRSHIHVVQWEDLCLSVPVLCRQCEDVNCILVCPTDALTRHPVTGAILLDSEACIFCEACVQECTFQVMQLMDDGLPVTCDLCNGNPECVLACYPGALRFGEVDDATFDESLRSVAQVLIERNNGKNTTPPEILLRQGELKK